MAQPNPTRRALIGAATTALAYAGGAAIVGTGLAVASEARGATLGSTAFRRAADAYHRAAHDFNTLPWDLEATDLAAFQRCEVRYHHALETVDATPATTLDELAEAFEIAFQGGDSLPGEELAMKLLADVRRLAGKAVLA